MIHIVKPGETLFAISEDYRTSFSSLLAANPGIDPNVIIVGQPINIPGLPSPSTIPYTIHISLSNRTLTLQENGIIQKVYPIGVGRMLHETPVGDFIIVNRAPNPGGPFGSMWLSLSKKSYGIHGTNDPASIGQYVSLGCVRMHNHDVNELAQFVPNGTAVYIRP
ncbi:L,D-transpeptidase family protein [Halalkalibacter akibai]|uniref:Protein erfK/srfK n=1 Tax=Halalkalibacter akibai (strain ATCC 43226 / DSM 21942 / CIP 109018 / JCM 9157 / 1139) TaxID=1236973 RepID=W4QXL1_HALA3|nr:L,D-transpeptidase family protein [Halalkalibacter akibai]GAE36870.1 protein erfK/srfK precursor [Halalkalibacter akibai JCM 9157]